MILSKLMQPAFCKVFMYLVQNKTQIDPKGTGDITLSWYSKLSTKWRMPGAVPKCYGTLSRLGQASNQSLFLNSSVRECFNVSGWLCAFSGVWYVLAQNTRGDIAKYTTQNRCFMKMLEKWANLKLTLLCNPDLDSMHIHIQLFVECFFATQ